MLSNIHVVISSAQHLSNLCRSVSTLVFEAGVNDIKNKWSEDLKVDFSCIADSLLDTGKQLIITGLFPSPCFGDVKFSCLAQLHTWLKGYCIKAFPSWQQFHYT